MQHRYAGTLALLIALNSSALAAYTSVEVTLRKGAGPLVITPSSQASPTLGAARPQIRGGAAQVSASHGVGVWNIGLSPRTPLSLNIHHETGSNEINLTGLPLNRLDLTTKAGPVTLNLPSRTLNASIRQETGSLEIRLPADTGLQLVIRQFGAGSLTMEGQTVASGVNLSGAFKTANYDAARYKVTVQLNHGSGPVEVYTPGKQSGN